MADVESYCWQRGLLLTPGVIADNEGLLLPSNIVADNGVIADNESYC
jgi:hypothetical protein